MLDPKCDYRAVVRIGEENYEGWGTVAINSKCYYTKTISFAQELLGKLKDGFPSLSQSTMSQKLLC